MKQKVTKKELIEAISLRTGFTQKDTETFMDAQVEAIADLLETYGKVEWRGFQTFEVKNVAEKEYYNIHTKQMEVAKAKKTAKSSLAKGFKNIFLEEGEVNE